MQKTLVWDLPTRLFHWLIVASLLAQYATVEWLENKVQWHFYIGYFTLFLIVFRLIWGVVGTRHARFSSFVTGPKRVFSYVKTLFNRRSEPAIGHNPLGGWFVIVMLVLLTIQAVSGLFMTDDIFLDGPYRQLASEETLGLMNTLHHLAFDVLLYVIALHIGAVIFYSIYKKQKLVPAMVHGSKDSINKSKTAGIADSRLLRALIVALVAATVVYVAIEVYPPAPQVNEYYY
ncbi:cytochrome B [Alteromonas sp. BL110]|uniref:cytochrome b/b6 domain-containing protein n=1 Tax=Alteromonas sp. BL110 TaxID=1714845 RepID=UPI000E4B7671|nr:cytochrome b/b6 domain-containing protein [Alteromonas sp. BL110]AXT40695.1 cytochrome B [Alteromonas sp. BL110]RKM81045.1 cytochrome B [Alteromonas sp. BL110]